MSGWIKGAWQVGKAAFKKQKTTGTEVVNPFKYKPAKSNIDKTVKDITVSVHKIKGRMQGDYQKMKNQLEEAKSKFKNE